jgi:hypothetical protein
MLRRALRAILVTSLALAVWAVARPAHASQAPLCDDRGATVLASSPLLEAPQDSIDRVRASVPCPIGDLPYGATIARGHRSAPASTSPARSALPTEVAVVVIRRPVARLEPRDRGDAPAEGVRARVERPPRG